MGKRWRSSVKDDAALVSTAKNTLLHEETKIIGYNINKWMGIHGITTKIMGSRPYVFWTVSDSHPLGIRSFGLYQ